jgi:hypothetical protein
MPLKSNGRFKFKSYLSSGYGPNLPQKEKINKNNNL